MNIVIVGAGYAGLRAALELSELRSEQHAPALEITLVDQEPYHQLVVLLHLAATAAVAPGEVALPLARIVRERGIDLRQGMLTAVETASQQIRLADGTAIAYDRLILALGTTTAYGDVAGAREHTFALRSYRQAIALRDHLVGCFSRAAQASEPQQRRRLLTVAIVGAGYTGIQLAGELGAWLPQLARINGLDPADVRIALLDRAPRLLVGMGGWASSEAERSLDQLRVSYYPNTSVERVEPGALLLDGGRRLRAETLVWAGGVVAPPLLGEAGLPVGPGGRVYVDEYLRALVGGQQVIYVAGDCALIKDQGDGFLPATASYALRQGDYLARQIMSQQAGETPEPYEPSHLGEIVSLGPGRAVGKPLGLPLAGLPAAMLKKGIEEWYLTTLEPGSIGAIL